LVLADICHSHLCLAIGTKDSMPVPMFSDKELLMSFEMTRSE